MKVFEFEVSDVQKKLGDLFVHYGKVKKGSLKLKDSVELKLILKEEIILEPIILLHIYCMKSLRRVLGTHVTQKGSLVELIDLRFDFSHMKPISEEEMEKLNIMLTQ